MWHLRDNSQQQLMATTSCEHLITATAHGNIPFSQPKVSFSLDYSKTTSHGDLVMSNQQWGVQEKGAGATFQRGIHLSRNYPQTHLQPLQATISPRPKPLIVHFQPSQTSPQGTHFPRYPDRQKQPGLTSLVSLQGIISVLFLKSTLPHLLL